MEFKSSERFHVALLSDDGNSTDRVVCQIGLDGLVVLNSDGQRTLRKYPLNHISRWALRSPNLVLYTKTPVDVEERTVTLQGSEHTIRSVLDTLTCSCMQCAPVLPPPQASTLVVLQHERQQAISTADSPASLQVCTQLIREVCTGRMVELLQSGEKTGETRQATNSLNALLSGGTPKQKAAAVGQRPLC